MSTEILINTTGGDGTLFNMPGQQQRIVFETDAPYYAELLGEYKAGQACKIVRDDQSVTIQFFGPSGIARAQEIADTEPKNLIFPATAGAHVWLNVYEEIVRHS